MGRRAREFAVVPAALAASLVLAGPAVAGNQHGPVQHGNQGQGQGHAPKSPAYQHPQKQQWKPQKHQQWKHTGGTPPGHTPYANHGGQQQGHKYPTPGGGQGIPGCGPSNSTPPKCHSHMQPPMKPPHHHHQKPPMQPPPITPQPGGTGLQPTTPTQPQQPCCVVATQPQQHIGPPAQAQSIPANGTEVAHKPPLSVASKVPALEAANENAGGGLPFTGLSLFTLLALGAAALAGGLALGAVRTRMPS